MGIYTTEFHLAVKINKIMAYAGKRMELEVVLLRHKPDSERISHMWTLDLNVCVLEHKSRKGTLKGMETWKETRGQSEGSD